MTSNESDKYSNLLRVCCPAIPSNQSVGSKLRQNFQFDVYVDNRLKGSLRNILMFSLLTTLLIGISCCFVTNIFDELLTLILISILSIIELAVIGISLTN